MTEAEYLESIEKMAEAIEVQLKRNDQLLQTIAQAYSWLSDYEENDADMPTQAKRILRNALLAAGRKV